MIEFILLLLCVFVHGIMWTATSVFWYRRYNEDITKEPLGCLCGLFWPIFWFVFLSFQGGRKLGHFISDTMQLPPIR